MEVQFLTGIALSARPSNSTRDDLNLSLTVLKACEILRALEVAPELLRLRDVVACTGLNKSTALRLLNSLQEGGLIERASNGQYRTRMKRLERRLYRIGYASEDLASAFCREVAASLTVAADLERIDLMVLDNHGSPKTSLQNVRKLLDAKVDLAIEHQPYEHLASSISDKFSQAGIPLVAVSFPHPGAVYYGPDNYAAGVIAGQALGAWAKQQTRPVEEVVFLKRTTAGSIVQARIKGIEDGLIRAFPRAATTRISYLDGNGEFSQSFDVVRRHFRFSQSDRILVGAVNDESAVGSLMALQQLGRTQASAVVSLGASAAGRVELRKPGTLLVGSVAFFPEKYGRDLLVLALKILEKQSVPASILVKHVLITPANVNLYYPQDSYM